MKGTKDMKDGESVDGGRTVTRQLHQSIKSSGQTEPDIAPSDPR